MRLIGYIITMIIGMSAEEKKNLYLKLYGYPKQTRIFVDRRANMCALIGTDTFKVMLNDPLIKKMEEGIKKNGHYKLP